MTKPGEAKGGGAKKQATRTARLADKLRQNLAKRKARARAARDGARFSSSAEPSEADVRRCAASASGVNERET